MALLKIGTIGPKTFTLGGHDPFNPIRIQLREEYKGILQHYLDEYGILLGVTSLSIGSEQDFAQCCIDCNIDYKVYIPYNNVESQWDNLPDLKQRYEKLLDKSLESFPLSEERFSPKRITDKNCKIIKECDIVIFIKTDLYEINETLFEMALNNNKRIHEIILKKNND